ncbi:phospholipase C [Chitinophaga rupis]|uniref:phospholipase C n=1 Tax=Chitinophaga rupis TaxID=573321 RepID=A0A1H7VT46_9BACT|nr:phospholipase C, phosphocholine-specific [Chitinophaga rupis]SEM12330.1 phospholipase C [Chitinophaga rupis]
MDTRREFLKKSVLLSGAAGLSAFMPASIQRALAIDPTLGSTYLDAEHVVILMQENRSFDHCFGTLQGVRGFNDPRALALPDKKPVWLQTNDLGETYAPFRLDIKDTKVTWMGSLPHSRASQVDANNNGKYDQWLIAKRSGNKQYAAMPLTLGYYNREDLPFNYAMADAFTICDQNFCSAMTSTTPNRSFFWTGKITHETDGIPKAHIRNDDYSYAKLPWNTFPELLEQNNIPWKFYQNETSCGGGFKGEERSWLSNFGCNLLEFFAAYNVKFAPRYIQNLQKQVDTLPDQINKLQEASPSSEEAAQKIRVELAKKQEVLDNAKAELEKWNQANFEKLSPEQKSLYKRAFVVNEGDPAYRNITTLSYTDGGQKRDVTVPEGDVLYQFRKDVEGGKLPTVSWLAAPQNFSDHPSAPWYGAWYVSEVLDILTKNPDVWKKTIFIVTYDENDGYFDHVQPFYIPDENKPETGKVSAGIDTEIEHVRLENELKQGVPKKAAREAPIGLGFRVPMIIASPWSRGGKVCSQLFDHTSTLQFLETFLNQKYKKNIQQKNISAWRRTICGDLTAAFSPFNGNKLEPIPFLQRDKFVEDIYNAKFKQEPGGYKKISGQEIRNIIENPLAMDALSTQEKGVRASSALPYELYAEGTCTADKKRVTLKMSAGNQVFGKNAAGSPFTVYAPGPFKDEKGVTDISRNWAFAVKAGDSISYEWPLQAFENNKYHLRLYGPNGFYRELIGNAQDPAIQVAVEYEQDAKTKKPTGNVVVKVTNQDAAKALQVAIKDHAYKTNDVAKAVAKGGTASIVLPLKNSHGWYDFSIKVNGFDVFEKRYAGRVETGQESFTDPFMGRAV